MNEYENILVFLGLFSGFVSLVVCQAFPQKYLWLGAITGFIFGFLLLFNSDTSLQNRIEWGVVVGIVSSIVMVISGLISKYYLQKGWEEYKKRKIDKM